MSYGVQHGSLRQSGGTGTVDASASTKQARASKLLIGSATATAVVTVYNGPKAAGNIVFQYTAPTGAVPVSFDLGGVVCGAGLTLDVATAAAEAVLTYF